MDREHVSGWFMFDLLALRQPNECFPFGKADCAEHVAIIVTPGRNAQKVEVKYQQKM
jgi:hypothetical protein